MAAEIDGDPEIFKILATDEQNDLALIKGDYINKNFFKSEYERSSFGEVLLLLDIHLIQNLAQALNLQEEL